MQIREYQQDDLKDMIKIWNEVVEEGNAFQRPIIAFGREAFGEPKKIKNALYSAKYIPN